MGEQPAAGQRRVGGELGAVAARLGGLLLRRVAVLAATLLAASVVVFVAMRVLPGDPASLVLGTGARADTLAALRHQMGLDRPLPLQYARWALDLLRLRLGQSFTYGVPVSRLVADRVAITAPLAAAATLLAVAVAIPVGAWAAARRGRPADALAMGVAQLGMAVPNFWAGLLLILVFAVGLGWLPAGGFPGWGAPLAALRALALPAVALALPQAAVLARVTRGAVVEVLAEDFCRTARARGLTRRAVLWRHALPNAMLPVLTILGLQVAFLLAGAVIVEEVFALPGLGRLLFQAIDQRDLVVVQDLVMLIVATVILANFLVDLLAVALDPRLRR